MIWPCGQVLLVLPLRPWWTEVGRFRVPLAQCRNLSSVFDHVWSMRQDVRVNELLIIFMIIWQLSGTTRAENWSNPRKLRSQHFDTFCKISGCKCRWSSTTVAVGMWHTFAQKDSVFFLGGGTQQKDCSSTGQQHHLGGPWAPLVMALRDLGVNLRWKLTAGLLLWLKAWYPFLSYHTVTLLQFRIAHVWPEHGTSIISCFTNYLWHHGRRDYGRMLVLFRFTTHPKGDVHQTFSEFITIKHSD